jgi:hypothetical protein
MNKIISVERYYDSTTRRFIVEVIRHDVSGKITANKRAFSEVDNAEDYAVYIEVIKRYTQD